jgi:hypothetical protein
VTEQGDAVMSNSQFFVVGKRGSGVIFVRTAPLRVAMVSHETIVEYEAGRPGIDGYAQVAVAAKTMMTNQDGQADTFNDPMEIEGIAALLSQGSGFCEADIAMVGGVVDEGWDFNRDITTPIDDVLMAVGPNSPETGHLFQAILSDSPNVLQ